MSDLGPSASASPSLAVIIPSHNRATQVTALVRQLANADGCPDEIIVVLDGCTDDSAEQLGAFPDGAVTVLQTSGEGPASARNRGAAASTADWIAFLDDDDHPNPEWVPTWRQLIVANPAARYLCVTMHERIGDMTRLRPVPAARPAFSGVSLSYMPGTYVIRRDLFEACGGFVDGLRYLECTELAMRVCEVIADDGDAVARTDAITIVRVGRPPEQRIAVRPEVLVPSTRLAHQSMARFLQREPALYATALAKLGVAELRVGDRSAGRATLRAAARAHPRPIHLGRMIVAHLPIVGPRLWSR